MAKKRLNTFFNSILCKLELASQLLKKIFDAESPLLLQLATIRKAKIQKHCEICHDSNVDLSLNGIKNCDPWKIIIKMLVCNLTDQLRVYNAFLKNEPAAKISIDATGNIVKKIDRPSGLSKYIFYYLILIKLPNESEGQISIAQILSEAHNTNTITYWLLECEEMMLYQLKK